jgi:hypothetical protein
LEIKPSDRHNGNYGREASLRNIDFSSWQSLLVTLIGLALFTLIGVRIRLLAMFTIQQRCERMNRQINERLRTRRRRAVRHSMPPSTHGGYLISST